MEIDYEIGETVIITDWADEQLIYALGEIEQIIIDSSGVYYTLRGTCRGSARASRIYKNTEENITKLKKEGYKETYIHNIL